MAMDRRAGALAKKARETEYEASALWTFTMSALESLGNIREADEENRGRGDSCFQRYLAKENQKVYVAETNLLALGPQSNLKDLAKRKGMQAAHYLGSLFFLYEPKSES